MRKLRIPHLVITSILLVVTILGTVQYTAAHTDGCDNTYCSECCEEGFTEDYRCVGNERQRLWQYSDCDIEWRTVDTCSYDCKDSKCIRGSHSSGITISTPSDRFDQETVYTTIKVSNFNDFGDWYNIDVYLCESDACDNYCGTYTTDCREMKCNYDRVYISGNNKKYIKCSRFVRNPGDYRIKVIYWTDDYRTRRTAYSGSFEVRGECDSEQDDYRCFGKYRQQKYVDDNCDIRWKIVEYCPYGCESSECVQPTELPKTGEPEIFMRTEYEMEKCKLSSFTFSIHNKGQTDTFDLETKGDVAEWVQIPPSVTIDKGETKAITAYASIPCNAISGNHEFILSSSSKTTDSRVGVITIPKEEGLFRTGPGYDLALIVFVFAIFVIAFFAYKKRPLLFRKRTSAPEEFNCECLPK